MSRDVIAQLGTLALASRLKRLSQRLHRDASRVYREQDLEFNARWFPVAYLLTQSSPMPVTAIAEAVGLTHVAINQIAAEMTRHGLLTSRRDRKDERRRLLSLSTKGRRTISDLQPVWESTRRCAGRLIAESGFDFLAGLRAIETALTRKDMYTRVQDDLEKKTTTRRLKK